MSANQYYQGSQQGGYQQNDRGYGNYGNQQYAPPQGPPPGQQYYPPQGGYQQQGYQQQQPVYVQQAQPQKKSSGGDTCCGICLGCCALFACEELCAAFM